MGIEQLNRRDVLKAASAFSLGGLSGVLADNLPIPTLISSGTGVTVAVSPDGVYTITTADPGWTFQGSIGQPLNNLRDSDGADSLGSWHEISFDHGSARSSALRVYDGKSIVLFSTRYGQDGPNVDPFPSFSSYPHGLFTFNYSGLWNYRFGALNTRTPWLFFDGQTNAFILSPASNFMTAVGQFASDGSMQAAIDSRIGTLPAGFTHRTLLSFSRGINAAFDSWGQALTGLTGKKRSTNDATTLLNQLSYWTDAGCAYYYHPQDGSQYVPTLLQMPPKFAQLSVPVASMELDSWHYPKGSPASWTRNDSGTATFQADLAVFPLGLAQFQQMIGLPLIAHARWIDATSELRKKYKISGNAAIDPLYWQDYAKYMTSSGIQVLEQDWLSGQAATAFNLSDPDAFLDNMASALAAAGRSIVYCMPLATHMLQSAKYDNVVAIRASNDGMRRARWDELLFDSRLVSAVGSWPFADAFLSDNLKDVLLATLTAGPVGTGDALASINASNLAQAVRADGVIVKPDAPIVPTDATFVAVAQSPVAPIVASTYTDHGGRRTAYVFAYERTDGARGTISFLPDDVGVSSPAYVYDHFLKAGLVLQTGAPFTATVDYNASYYVIAPIGPSGIAFLGDAGKFVSCGKKRIEQLTDDGMVRVQVRFAPSEKRVVLHFYAPSRPVASATEGRVGLTIPDSDDRYSVTVSPGASGAAIVHLRVPTHQTGRPRR